MRIVAFLDRSVYAQSVLDHTVWLAGRHNARVTLVHVVAVDEFFAANIPPIHPGGPVVLLGDMAATRKLAELREQGQFQLEAAKTQLLSNGISDVAVHLCEGDIQRHLAEAADLGDIVIMGKRGENADLARLPLGANFEPLVRRVPKPVLAVSRLFRPVERMLVAFDLDEGSAQAIETLVSGILPPAPLLVLHVGETSDAVSTEMERVAAKLRATGYPAVTEIIDGSARDVIPDRVVSDEIGLVAMGAFGSSRMQSLIFGSLTNELIRACQVPILLCH